MAPPQSPMVESPACKGHKNGLQRKSPFPRDAPAKVWAGKQEVKVWMPSGKVQSSRSSSATPTPPTPRRRRAAGDSIDLARSKPDSDTSSVKGLASARYRSESPSYMAPTTSFQQRIQKEERRAKRPKKLPPVPRKPRMSMSTESILSTTTEDQTASQCKQLTPGTEESEGSKCSTDTNAYVRDEEPTVVVPETPMELPEVHHRAPPQVPHKKTHKSGLKSLICCVVPSASTYD